MSKVQAGTACTGRERPAIQAGHSRARTERGKTVWVAGLVGWRGRHPAHEYAGTGSRGESSADTPVMGGADVMNVRTFVGLDAHAVQTLAAVLDRDTGELWFRRLNGPTGG